MAKKKENKHVAGKPAQVWKEDNPGGFPVTDPTVLKGLRGSVKAEAKGRAKQARFKAWAKGIDYDAVKDAQNG